MSGSSGGGSTTQTQKLDPWMKDQIEGNLERIQGLQGYEAYPTEDAIAPLSPEMQNTMNQMGQMGQMGYGVIDQGLQGLQNAAGTQAQQVGMQDKMQPQQVGPAQLDMSQFQNPFQAQVVDQTMQDMDRARQMAVGQTEDAAIGAGAFGGSRHGVADAETNRAFADRAGAVAGQLNQQGFNTALSAAQQQQGVDMQSQLANQQAGMSADQFNIGTDLGAQQANQSAALDASRLGLLGSQNLLSAGQGLFGQGAQAAQMGQDYEQAQRDFDFQQYMQEFQDPRTLAQMEGAAIQGIPFMGTTSTQQPGGSGLGSTIGGGLSGAAMGAQIGSVVPGLGTAMGAGVGGGLGLLGGMFG